MRQIQIGMLSQLASQLVRSRWNYRGEAADLLCWRLKTYLILLQKEAVILGYWCFLCTVFHLPRDSLKAPLLFVLRGHVIFSAWADNLGPGLLFIMEWEGMSQVSLNEQECCPVRKEPLLFHFHLDSTNSSANLFYTVQISFPFLWQWRVASLGKLRKDALEPRQELGQVGFLWWMIFSCLSTFTEILIIWLVDWPTITVLTLGFIWNQSETLFTLFQFFWTKLLRIAEETSMTCSLW